MLEATDGKYPRAMIVENVPGLLSVDGGDGFKLCLDLIQELGFIVDPNLLDAQYMGVPQRRKRVYIVCLNVNHILNGKTTISDSIMLQLLTELLQINLTELLKASGAELKKSAVLGLKHYEDGLMRRTRLFSLQKEDRLLMLQNRLDEMRAMYSKELNVSDSIHGGVQMDVLTSMAEDMRLNDSTTGSLYKSTGALLKTTLEEGLQIKNESIISTWTKQTMDQRICFYIQALLNTLKLTTLLMQSLEKTNPMLLNYYEWALYTSTEMREFINAGKKHEKRFGKLGWNDLLRDIECEFYSIGDEIERYFGAECSRKVLSQREGVRGYFAKSRTQGQGITENAERCSGADDRAGDGEVIAIDQQGGKGGANYAIDVMPTMCSDSHGTPHAVAYSFDSLASNSMKSANPHSGCRPVEISKTLDTTDPNLSKNQGGIAVVQRVYESHPMDSRIKELEDIAPTVSVKWHKGAADTPLVCTKEENLVEVYDARGNGDGKTVSTITGDHENRITDYSSVVVEPVVYNGENITSPINKANPQPGDPCHTLSTDSRNYAVFCLHGNGIDRADTAGCNGKGWREDACYTLNTIDRPAVAYAINHQGGNVEQITEEMTGTLTASMNSSGNNKLSVAFAMQGFGDYKESDKSSGLKARDYKDATDLVCVVDCRNGVEYPELNGTLQAKPGGGTSLNYNPVVRVKYIVRRLTPTECARLQGFPDWWGHIEQKETLTDEEYRFWLEVRNTHAAINGKAVKEYNVKQMLTWYNKLWTDSTEYKMWGNGIALPPALYVLQGIADAMTLSKEETDAAMTMAYDIVAEDEVTDLSDAPEEIKTEIVAIAEKLEDREHENTEEETMEQKIVEKQETENAPIDFVAAAQLRKLAEERKTLANLRPNDPRFADDVRALEFAVSVLEAVGL